MTPRVERDHALWSPNSLVLGCDYSPEQWPESVWIEDIRLMKQAGVSLVAINIFGWASIEPRAGEYEFGQLDAIIELLHAAEIQVNLGTATASPPPWLATKYPDILPVAADGTKRWPGGRQAWCPSSPDFRREAMRLVAAVVQRYGSHPAVAMWHVSNELGCHNALCYCDESARAFRRWLSARYHDIESLNDAWGTTFWSQRYSSWDDVLPPRTTLSAANPAQRIDFARFSSDELLDYFRGEADIIRSMSNQPVTTNFMVTAHVRTQNYWQWAADMDVIANDHYVDNRLPNPATELAFAADLTRGLAGGAPWLLMEQSTSAVSWQPHNIAKQPGEMMRNTMTHVARGADGVCFFQWRASRQGAEKFHSALLPHAGTDSAIWRETLELGSLLGKLDEIVGTRVESDVAMVFSWEAWWSAEGDSQPSSSVRYLEQVHAAYAALRAAGVTVDLVAPGAPLDGYRLVMVPSLYMVSDLAVSMIESFVADGGAAVVTFFSGIVDETDSIRLDPTGAVPPGAFSSLIGAWTEQFFPLAPNETIALTDGSAPTIWSERVRVTTADVIARFESGPVAGDPAITRNSFGRGTAWYVATALDELGLAAFIVGALDAAGVTYRLTEPGLEIIVRSSDRSRFTFFINHNDRPVSVDAEGAEIVTGVVVLGRLEVPAGSVRIVRHQSAVREAA